MSPLNINTDVAERHEVCLHPERWVQIQEQLRTILKEVSDVKDAIQDLHDRTFVDNGKPCHQTRLQSLESRVAAIMWVVSAIGTVLIGSVVHSFYLMIVNK